MSVVSSSHASPFGRPGIEQAKEPCGEEHLLHQRRLVIGKDMGRWCSMAGVGVGYVSKCFSSLTQGVGCASPKSRGEHNHHNEEGE